MPFFVLLLKPKVKKFELIQFQRIPEKATVGGVLSQLRQLSSNPEFQSQENIGLYCYQTKTEFILPKYQNLLLPDTPSNESTTTPKSSRLSDVSGTLTTTTSPLKEATSIASDESSGEAQSPAPTTITSTADADSPAPCSADQKMAVTENDSVEGSPAKEDTGDQNEATVMTPSLTVSSTQSKQDKEQESLEDPVLDIEAIGWILVAIPKDHQLKHVLKQAKRILESPAFKLLTQGNSLEESTKTTTQQELEQLQQQKVTQQVSHHLSKQVSQAKVSTAAYQQQMEDLEQRRRRQQETEPQLLLSPDAHGLSPLDAMRVAQNQQKAAARQQERGTLPPYQRHSDTSGRNTAASTTSTSTSADISPKDSDSTTTTTTLQATPTDDHETTTPFFSSSLAKRRSMKQQTQAELDEIRKKGITKTTTSSARFCPEEEQESVSLLKSLAEERREELAVLSQQGIAKSWRGPLSAPPATSQASMNNRSVRSFVTTQRHSFGSHSGHTSSSTTRDAELEDLRKQGLAKGNGDSLREMQGLERKSSNMLNSSISELEELKELGLAKSIKSQFTDTVKDNQEKSHAYEEQQRDLEERKAKTTAFRASQNQLSAADATQLEYSKKKKEERVKEREALGYYQNYRGEQISSNSDDQQKDWKKKGEVHETIGTSNAVTTKVWEAPTEDGKMEVSKPPNLIATSSPKQQAPEGAGGDETKQGCACIIL